MKYQCRICDTVFDEPYIHTEKDDFQEGGVYRCKCCPICFTDEIDEFYETEDDDEQ